MSGKMSRNKGAAYERRIAKILTAWWGTKFFRTPLSGGHQDMSNEMNIAGDLVTKDVLFPFHLELKKQEGWNLEHLLTSDKMGKIGDWFRQAKKDCKPGKIPFLIFSKNYSPDFFLLQRNDMTSIQSVYTQNAKIFKMLLYRMRNLYVIPYSGHIVGLLDEFVEVFTREEIIQAGDLKKCHSMTTNAKNAATKSKDSIKSVRLPQKLRKRARKKKK